VSLTNKSKFARKAVTILIPRLIVHVDHKMPGLTEALSTDIAAVGLASMCLCQSCESKFARQAETILIPIVIFYVDHQMPRVTEALSTDRAAVGLAVPVYCQVNYILHLTSESKVARRAFIIILIPSVIFCVDHQMTELTKALSTDSACVGLAVHVSCKVHC
jgi:hypothetical protein